MLQNRVDPFGNLIKTKARGAWMGNRGVIHNESQEILRPFKLKAWIICKLQFKGRQRKIMSPNRWTELFFLDEATAFAAGHRPCFECRREDANKFKTQWLKGNPEYGFDQKTSIQKVDEIIHRERIDRKGSKVVFEEDIHTIPNGCFVVYDDAAFLVLNKVLFPWSPSGYGQSITFPDVDKIRILTPKSVVNAFRAGYLPEMAVALS
ncbi:MAG TPA: hypothetical protein VIU12_10920 [Chryseolinea sp.]